MKTHSRLLVLVGGMWLAMVVPVRAGTPPPAKASPNAFALALFQELAREQGNLVVSPIGVYTAFSMLYAGARGETERELAATFRFAVDQGVHHSATSKLLRAVGTPKAPRETSIHLAHALWPDQKLQLLSGYPEAMAKAYLAQVTPLDFGQPANAAAIINAWVGQQTRGRIPSIVEADAIKPNAALQVTTAAYFAGRWQSRFQLEATRNMAFALAPSKYVEVPMMYQCEKLLYAEDSVWQAADLEYRGGDYGLIVLLPRDAAALPQLEQTLTVDALGPVLARLRMREIELFLPRFELKRDLALEPPLESLGLRTVWEGETANFSGLTANRIFVTNVTQRATIAVDEKGTVAAAATRAEYAFAAAEYPVMRVDRPFLFLLRHRPSGTILFVGRVADPRG